MRHLFGWDLPPGVTQRMIDEAYGADAPCMVCGGWPDSSKDPCICGECPKCGTHGDPDCYNKHGMVRTYEQRIGLAWLEAQIEETSRQEEALYDKERAYCEACGYTESHDPNCPLKERQHER